MLDNFIIFNFNSTIEGSSIITLRFLFQKLMAYDPNRRISAKNALLHPYFDNVAIVPNIDLPTNVSFSNSVHSD